MAEAFRGEFYQKVDGKARVSIPAAFRAVLNADDPQKGEKGGARLVLVYGGKTRNFVEGYSKRGADQLAEDIEAMEMGSPERVRAERDLISRSVMVEVDPDGRIVLPPRVREKMGAQPASAEQATVQPTTLQNAIAWGRLYDRAQALCAEIGYAGSVSTDDDEVELLMDALHAIDGGEWMPGLLPAVAAPAPSAEQQPVAVQQPKSGGGAVMGAIAGGAMGNAIGDGGGRAAAAPSAASPSDWRSRPPVPRTSS